MIQGLRNPICKVQLLEDEPQGEPDNLDEGDDAHAKHQAQKSTNVGKEVNPSHADLKREIGKGRNLSAADNFRQAMIPDHSDKLSVHSNHFDLG